MRRSFLSTINELSQLLVSQDVRDNAVNTVADIGTQAQPVQSRKAEMPERYYINEFGEIIRPARTEQLQQNGNKLSFKQKVAHFILKNNLFMNLPFVKNFVHKQLDMLPSPIYETRASPADERRIQFENRITNFGRLRNLPPIQRMSDPQKLEKIRRKMNQHTHSSDDNPRGR